MVIYGNIDMKRSGEKMKKLLTRAGYDVKSIQNYLHLSCPQPVYRWFKGQILPTVDHLFMMSKLLGIHMEDFLVERETDEQKSVFLTYIDFVLEEVETGKYSANSRIICYYKFLSYHVPIMKVQTYSLDDIFEKRLLMLIPFYIFSYEKNFPEYNSNEQKLEELKAEYRMIFERLDELEQQGVIGAFDKRTIIELSGVVIKEIAQKYENVQKGVGEMMRGALIETEARTILNQGIKQGIKQGITQGKSQGINETKQKTALRMLQDGELSIDKIAKYSGLEVEEVEQLAGLQTV